MKNRMKFALAACAALIYLSCQKDPFSATTPGDPVPDSVLGVTRNGYFSVTVPVYGGAYRYDSLVTIRWSSGAVTVSHSVVIALYRNDTLIQTVTSLTSNDGSQSWTIPHVATGNRYRLKLSSYTDPSLSDFSSYFTIKSQYTGTLAVTAPTAGTAAKIDSALQIRWTRAGTIGGYVTLQLFSDTAFAGTIVTGASDNGLYSWSALSTTKGSGTKYRVKIMAYYDSSIYAFSGYFTVSSPYNGTLTVTAPDSSATWVSAGGSQTIQWTSTGSPGAYVNLQLFRNDTAVYAISTGTSNDGIQSWSVTTLPTGKYRIKISSYYDAGISDFSDTFQIASQYFGTYSFVAPDSSATWAAGTSYNVQWTSTGSPGTYVNLDLVNDTGLVVYALVSGASNDGTQSVSLPGYTATGRYRIKISSYYDAGISALSESFTIAGVDPDTFEPDNQRIQASLLSADGTVQQHSIIYPDTDWIKFTLDSGKTYYLRNSGTLATYAQIYKGNRTSYTTYFYGGTQSPGYLLYTPDSTGTWYARVTQYSSGGYGDYSFSVTRIDSMNLVTFANPTPGTTWAAGSNYQVQWTTDSLFNGYVYLYLYNDTTYVLSLSSSYVYMSGGTSGTYSWTLPSGLASGDKYRIKVVDYNSSGLYGFSTPFTVSGTTPDAYELDNSRASAKSIAVNGVVQQRSLTYADSDWISFTAQKDSLYVITATGSAYLYLYLYYDQQTSYLTYDSYSNPQIVWTATAGGTYYIRAVPYSSSYYGNYALTVRQHSPNGLVSFLDPTAATTWSAGTNYTLQWVPDTALFGTYVNLSLVRGATTIYSISSSTANDGSQSWTPPAGLVTANDYRIKMANASLTQVTGFSDSFTVSGVLPDAAEPDDSVGAAHAMSPGVPENRSLSYLDRDWVAFSAKRGYVYKLTAAGSVYPYISFYSTDKQTLLTSASGTLSASVVWYIPLDGIYYASVTSSGGTSGAYTLTLTEYDSSAYRFRVTTPAAADTFSVGSTCDIQWVDSLGLGGTVDLFLYSGLGVMQTIVTGTSNSGSYSWVIPGTVAARNDYYIRVISRINSNISGNSAAFEVH